MVPELRNTTTSASAIITYTDPAVSPAKSRSRKISTVRVPCSLRSVTEVGLADGVVVAQHLTCAAGHDDAHLEQVRTGSDVQREGRVLLDQQECGSQLGIELSQDPEHLLDDHRGQTEADLVAQQQAGP